MLEYDHLLIIAKDATRKALQSLAIMNVSSSSYAFCDELPREMKSTADGGLEEIILGCLLPTRLPILSEEVGELGVANMDGLRWVVDPLDGTVNLMRRLAPCAVSIALCRGNSPVFGVIGQYPDCTLAWGGRSFGAFIEEFPIHVSTIQDKAKAVLCTGFPSRFEFTDRSGLEFIRLVSSYAKVRMFGAASLSLLNVAKGSADFYAEQNIMIWDVAAGLAIVEGAGGSVRVLPGQHQYSHNVAASNGILQFD
jgi:myo-inositol-1(or 4)-monophosphatase